MRMGKSETIGEMIWYTHTIFMKTQHKSGMTQITSVDQQTVSMYLCNLAETLGLHGIDRQLTTQAMKTLIASRYLELLIDGARVCLSNENVSKRAPKSEHLQHRISYCKQRFSQVPNAHLLSTRKDECLLQEWLPWGPNAHISPPGTKRSHRCHRGQVLSSVPKALLH